MRYNFFCVYISSNRANLASPSLFCGYMRGAASADGRKAGSLIVFFTNFTLEIKSNTPIWHA